MKPSFLLLIFKPPFGAREQKEIAKLAFELKYTMFCFNGTVYDTAVQKELFNLSDLLDKY